MSDDTPEDSDKATNRHWLAAGVFALGLVIFSLSAVAYLSAWTYNEVVVAHPFAVRNLPRGRSVVSLEHLGLDSLWTIVLVFVVAMFVLIPAYYWLCGDKRGPTYIAKQIYCSVEEDDKHAKGERQRREGDVEDWSNGYSVTALTLLMLEAFLFVVTGLASISIRPSDGSWVEVWESTVGALFVVRFLTWFAILGFIAWVLVRPRLVDTVIDPSPSTEEDSKKGDEDKKGGQDKKDKDGSSVDTVLALSGGGIRSAAFSLGAMDALQVNPAEWGRIDRFCAVSGGAYAAGALAGLRAKRPTAGGPDGKVSEGGSSNADALLRLGGPALRYIRNHSNYLAPGIAGKVRAFNDWGSGFVVTLLLYATSVFLVGGVLGFVAAFLQENPRSLELGVAGLAIVAAGIIGVLTTTVAHAVEKPKAALRRSGEVFGWIWGILAFLVIVVPTFFDVVDYLWTQVPVASKWIGGLIAAGALTGATVWSIVKQASAPVATFLAGLIVPLLTIAGLATAAWISVEFNPLNQGFAPPVQVWVGAGVVVFFIVVSLFLPANGVSLHPFYQERLSTAFSLERVRGRGSDPPEADVDQAKPPIELSDVSEAFIICAAANVMGSPITPPGRGALSFTFSSDCSGLPSPSPFNTSVLPSVRKPSALTARSDKFPVMKAVAISGAAVSPGMGKLTRRSYEALLALFNIRLGVWLRNPLDPAAQHESSARTKEEGTHRLKPPWLDRWMKRRWFDTRMQKYPRMFPYFYKELLGLHNLLDPHLYITDGGHWDNLGLVEALRQKPRRVIILDSSGDRPGTYRTLGEAKSLAEMQLGVRITGLDTSQLFDASGTDHERVPEPQMEPDDAENSQQSDTSPEDSTGMPVEGKKHWWSRSKDDPQRLPERCFMRGTATIPNAEHECEIIYCRALVTQGAPVDITSFKAKHPSFPNHSTLRQLFDDETFEAYRALGYTNGHMITERFADTVEQENGTKKAAPPGRSTPQTDPLVQPSPWLIWN